MIALPNMRGCLSGFNPLSLAPSLWLSDTGSNVAQWDDLSGNGRHATQATVSMQPSIVTNVIAGKQVRRFDGVNDFMSGDLPVVGTSGMVFAVFRDTEASGRNYQTVVSGGDSSNKFSINSNFATYDWGLGKPGGQSAVATITLPASTPSLFVAEWTGVSVTNRFNGVTNTAFLSSAPLSATKYYLAQHLSTGYSWAGVDIAEVLYFVTPLSTANRVALTTYLNGKYSL